jgi:putative component of membrane protein insertase Oxa1/YidC/SpoIIIJ protein YidD
LRPPSVARYKLRQQTAEPVFGNIVKVLRCHRLSQRGLAAVTNERELVRLARQLKASTASAPPFGQP